MPAHITVVFPFLEPARLTEEGLLDVGRLVGYVSAFSFELGSPQRFRDTSVLFLPPSPDRPFRLLTQAVADRFGTLPYGGRFRQVIPHLTVVDGALTAVMEQAEAALATAVPIRCQAEEVCLFVFQGSQWTVLQRYSFARGEQ